MQTPQTKPDLLHMLQHEYNLWGELLRRIPPDRITNEVLPGGNTVLSEINHLYAWQTISVARLQSAHDNTPPQYPEWTGGDPDRDDADPMNARIKATYGNDSWETVYGRWNDNYKKLIHLALTLPDADLFSTTKYPWLNGSSPADIVRYSMEHHHDEHYEPLAARFPGTVASR